MQHSALLLILYSKASNEVLKCIHLECAKGYYRDALNNECMPCPIGTYSDTQDAATCTTCPLGQTTSQEGSNINLQCYTGMKLEISLFLT